MPSSWRSATRQPAATTRLGRRPTPSTIPSACWRSSPTRSSGPSCRAVSLFAADAPPPRRRSRPRAGASRSPPRGTRRSRRGHAPPRDPGGADRPPPRAASPRVPALRGGHRRGRAALPALRPAVEAALARPRRDRPARRVAAGSRPRRPLRIPRRSRPRRALRAGRRTELTPPAGDGGPSHPRHVALAAAAARRLLAASDHESAARRRPGRSG